MLEAANGLPPLVPTLVASTSDVDGWFLPSLFLIRSLPAFSSGRELPATASGPAPNMRDAIQGSPQLDTVTLSIIARRRGSYVNRYACRFIYTHITLAGVPI